MKPFALSILVLFNLAASAQTKLPVIRATSKAVAIKDGNYLDKEAWSLSPSARPDIYTADRSRETKWVTFYTDIDSIRVKIKPGTTADFVILLNGKDSCFTRVVSAIPPEDNSIAKLAKIDTIPFKLSEGNAIAMKGVINGVDTLYFHFDASSYDFHLTQDAILNRTHLLADKANPNYRKLNKTNTLQMGTMTWTDAPVTSTQFTATGMDGRMGWTLFGGKTVELNVDKGLMIISSQAPKNIKGFTKLKMGFTRSYPYLSGEFSINGKKYKGDFILDNGSDQALLLDGNWAARVGFPTDSLKLIRTAEVSDPRGVKYVSKMVSVPAFSLAESNFATVPTLVMGTKNPMGIEINYLGNDIMKRFNLIFDFKNDYLYLKPNKYFGVKFKENS